MLAHKNYRTTQRYAHIVDSALRDAVKLTSKTIVRDREGQEGSAGSLAQATITGAGSPWAWFAKYRGAGSLSIRGGRAWDQAGALHPQRRIRLRIDDAAPELHALPWEMLQDPSPAATVRFLAADLDTPFSRHVASPRQPLDPAVLPLKVLTAVAAPAGLEDYGLDPIDRAGEQALLEAVFAAAPAGLVQHTALARPCTLTALAAELERGYHVLHVVAHGAVTSDLTGSVIFLERADGGVERVDAARFAAALDCLSPSLRLIVLMSCSTATRNPRESRFGFAPSLLAAGVPAVLAMQDLIPMSTAAVFTRAFYEELWRSGQIDRAANRARRVIVTERLPGNAVPALYATGTGLSLWPQDQKDMESSGSSASVAAQRRAVPAAAKAADVVAQVPTNAPGEPEPHATWEEFGGPVADLQVVVGPGGCLQAFGLDYDHVLRYRRELTPGAAWGEWEQFATGTTAFTVAADPRGRVAVFAVDAEGQICHRSAGPSGDWSAWIDQFGVAEQIAAVYRKDGSLFVLTQAQDGIFVVEQRRADGGWNEWYGMQIFYESFTIARNGADHLFVFGIAEDGTLWVNSQPRPRGDWEECSELGPGFRCVRAFAGPDGCLHLLGLDVRQGLEWTAEATPGGVWQNFTPVPMACSDGALAWRNDGALEAFVISAGALWTMRSRDGEHGPWQPLGGQQLEHVRAVATRRGTVEVFAVDESGKAFRVASAP